MRLFHQGKFFAYNGALKKDIKKGKISESEAFVKLGAYLDMAIMIFDQNTQNLEAALNKAKSPDEIDAVLSKVVIK